MLSASNVNALEDAGLAFVVGSRLTKAPYDLEEHFTAHGNHFADGQILESTRLMGTGPAARQRKVVYQWSFTRNKRDDRNINLMIAKAEKIAAGTTPMRKARFLKASGAVKELDQATIDRARQLAGIKSYVTNLPQSVIPGSDVIGAYHDPWRVEQSFRMTKSDLKARSAFHHRRDASRTASPQACTTLRRSSARAPNITSASRPTCASRSTSPSRAAPLTRLRRTASRSSSTRPSSYASSSTRTLRFAHNSHHRSTTCSARAP
ncbi:hypothetical protein [Demequina sp.]|uniref:IS1634 family transposase n=1 Tax=Demequina sp. TaxID=2050685 RepID=UPI00344F18B0